MITSFAVSFLLGLPDDRSDDVAEPAPAVVYVLVAPQDRERPIELVRFVGGQISERNRICKYPDLDFGLAGNRLAMVYWSESGGERVSLWDLASGKRVADSAVTGPQIVSRRRTKALHPHHNLILDATGRKAIVSDGDDCGSIDLLHGKKVAFKAPGQAFGDFVRVKNQVGLRLKTGEFAPYLAETDLFAEPVRFEGIAAEWTSYVPGVGLTCNEKVSGRSVFTQLSDDSLQPLAEKRTLNFAPPGRQRFGALPDGHPFVLFYTSAENRQTTVVIRDIQTDREILKQTFDFEAHSVDPAADGHAFLMLDRNRRALHFNRSTQKTTLVDYSILREPDPENKPERETRLYVIYFGTAQLPEKAPE